MNILVEKLKLLPQRKGEVWQGGVIRMPAWAQGDDGKPCRPKLPLWVSVRTKLVHTPEPDAQIGDTCDDALAVLADFACNSQFAGYCPSKLEVKDAALAAHLSELLRDAGITVEKRDKLFAVEEAMRDLEKHIAGKPVLPSATDARGITVDAMRAFADAAARFYLAKPWEELTNEDVICVESPSVDAALRYFSVLGGGRREFGLGFYESLLQLEELMAPKDTPPEFPATEKHWVVLFGDITCLPFGDADLWEDLALPVASDEAYPLAVCYQANGKSRRPGPDVLALLEGLLRALAATDVNQMDAGRWTREVNTARGQMRFVLSLPYLLDEDGSQAGDERAASRRIMDHRCLEKTQADIHRILEQHEFASDGEMQRFVNENVVGKKVPEQQPRSPLEKAQNLVYEAFESRGRKRSQLARKALEICPDCADAYTILAEQTPDVQKACDLYRQGVVAGEKALGKKFFDEDVGHFWGILSTRPYMRSLYGLAECLHELGRLDEALRHYRELIRLNPNDNQGVREPLTACLLEMNENRQAEESLKQHKLDKDTAWWQYARVLLTFRQKGDVAAARKYLTQAIDANKFVPGYLLSDEVPHVPVTSYSFGSEEEAFICTNLLRRAWEATDGALDWLESQVGGGSEKDQ